MFHANAGIFMAGNFYFKDKCQTYFYLVSGTLEIDYKTTMYGIDVSKLVNMVSFIKTRCI
jgi:hypothetical protein